MLGFFVVYFWRLWHKLSNFVQLMTTGINDTMISVASPEVTAVKLYPVVELKEFLL